MCPSRFTKPFPVTTTKLEELKSYGGGQQTLKSFRIEKNVAKWNVLSVEKCSHSTIALTWHGSLRNSEATNTDSGTSIKYTK